MGHTLTARGEAPEATRYYSQMTENQKAEIRHDTVIPMMDDARLAVRVMDPKQEAQRLEWMMLDADDRTREVLERTRLCALPRSRRRVFNVSGHRQPPQETTAPSQYWWSSTALRIRSPAAL
jgi:hypothetical protein